MTTPENYISELKRITLTNDERSMVRAKLRAYASSHVPMQGFFSKNIQWIARHSALALGGAVILVGGVTTVSAHFANPGDALYGFRTEINDRVQTALTLDEEKRIDVEMQQIQRMIEAEDSYRDEALSESAMLVQEDVQRGDESEDVEDADEMNVEEKFDDGEFDRELNNISKDIDSEINSRLELE